MRKEKESTQTVRHFQPGTCRVQTVSRGRGRVRLRVNDIYVLPSFAVEVVGVGELSDSGWEFGSECCSDAVSGVLVVSHVGETAPSVVTVMWEGAPSDSERDFCGTAVLCLSPKSATSLVWKIRKT